MGWAVGWHAGPAIRVSWEGLVRAHAPPTHFDLGEESNRGCLGWDGSIAKNSIHISSDHISNLKNKLRPSPPFSPGELRPKVLHVENTESEHLPHIADFSNLLMLDISLDRRKEYRHRASSAPTRSSTLASSPSWQPWALILSTKWREPCPILRKANKRISWI